MATTGQSQRGKTTSKRDMSNAPMTYDRLKSMKKPQTSSVHIALDSDLAEELEEAEKALGMAQIMTGADEKNPETAKILKEAQERRDAAREAAKKQSVKFTFRSIGRKNYDALVRSHPPTDEQRKKAEENGDDPDDLEFDVDNFPPALAARSIVEPKMSEEEFMEMWDSDDWSGPELNAMFWAALQANKVRGVVSLGKD